MDKKTEYTGNKPKTDGWGDIEITKWKISDTQSSGQREENKSCLSLI